MKDEVLKAMADKLIKRAYHITTNKTTAGRRLIEDIEKYFEESKNSNNKLHDFQKEAIKHISEKSGTMIIPTGLGKHNNRDSD